MTYFLVLIAALAPAWAVEYKHDVVDDDTMWDLAARYYKDPYQWRRIADANPRVKDPHWIYPGNVLIIPEYVVSVPVPEPEPPPPVPPPAPPVKEPVVEEPPPPVQEPPSLPEGFREVGYGLSDRMPKYQTGQGPSLKRYEVPGNFKWAGKVRQPRGETYLSAPGGVAVVRLGSKVTAGLGDTFGVYRKTVPSEKEAGSRAQYVQGIGRLKLTGPLRGRVWEASVLEASDVIQPGDLVVKE